MIMDGPRTRLNPNLLLILGIGGLLFFWRLDLPLLEPQEARYAEIPRQMLDTGSWLTPVLHGQPYSDKPPLLYWLVMSCYSVLGVHDWAARLVPGLAGLLTVLTTYLWGRRVVGERAGLIGGLILCLSARYLYLGRMLTFDTLLCLFLTASLASAHIALRDRLSLAKRWWLLSAVTCGLGILTKGPVALLLVIVPLAAVSLLDRQVQRPRWTDWLLYLLVCLATAGPWFLYMALEHPTFVEHFFWQHHVVRFLQPFDHQEPFWFHLPGLLVGMLPWTLLLPGLIRWQLRRARKRAHRRSVPVRFFLLYAGWGLLFFSLSGCKRATYVLPILPPLALALGSYLDVLLRLQRQMLAGTATLLMLGLGAGGSVTAAISGLLTWRVATILAAVALLVLVRLAFRRQGTGWRHCFLTTFALLFLALEVLMPAYHERFALRSCVEACREVDGIEESPIACFPHGWDSISFYLRRNDLQIYGPDQRGALLNKMQAQPRTFLFLKKGRAANELLEHLPEDIHFIPKQSAGSVLVGWLESEKKKSPQGKQGSALLALRAQVINKHLLRFLFSGRLSDGHLVPRLPLLQVPQQLGLLHGLHKALQLFAELSRPDVPVIEAQADVQLVERLVIAEVGRAVGPAPFQQVQEAIDGDLLPVLGQLTQPARQPELGLAGAQRHINDVGPGAALDRDVVDVSLVCLFGLHLVTHVREHGQQRFISQRRIGLGSLLRGRGGQLCLGQPNRAGEGQKSSEQSGNGGLQLRVLSGVASLREAFVCVRNSFNNGERGASAPCSG
jgi:4-amino-4-deoxy-L-arabinose transferase-like glycosyltransferase